MNWSRCSTAFPASGPLESRFPTVNIQQSLSGWSLQTDKATVALDGEMSVTGRAEHGAPAAAQGTPAETD